MDCSQPNRSQSLHRWGERNPGPPASYPEGKGIIRNGNAFRGRPRPPSVFLWYPHDCNRPLEKSGRGCPLFVRGNSLSVDPGGTGFQYQTRRARSTHRAGRSGIYRGRSRCLRCGRGLSSQVLLCRCPDWHDIRFFLFLPLYSPDC